MTTAAIASSLAAGVFLGLVLLTVALYNHLVALHRRGEQVAADIDVQLRRRHDRIVNLVEAVMVYARLERGTADAVMQACDTAVLSPSARAEAALGGALGRLMTVAAAYPELTASTSFAEMQAAIAETENMVAAARRELDGAAHDYDTARERFPSRIVANLFGFEGSDAGTPARGARGAFERAPAARY